MFQKYRCVNHLSNYFANLKTITPIQAYELVPLNHTTLTSIKIKTFVGNEFPANLQLYLSNWYNMEVLNIVLSLLKFHLEIHSPAFFCFFGFLFVGEILRQFILPWLQLLCRISKGAIKSLFFARFDVSCHLAPIATVPLALPQGRCCKGTIFYTYYYIQFFSHFFLYLPFFLLHSRIFIVSSDITLLYYSMFFLLFLCFVFV